MNKRSFGGIMVSPQVNKATAAVLVTPRGHDTMKGYFMMQPQSNRVPYFPTNLESYAPWVAAYGLVAPYGKCQCGCGQDAPISDKTERKYLLREGHPKRYVRNHHIQDRTIEAAFWKHVEVAGDSECWLWRGTIQPSGYGSFCYAGIHRRASRSSYEINVGPIPAGMHVMHVCDNPACVNPSHLRLGTHDDNMMDRNQKGRQARGERTGSAKLTRAEVLDMRQLAQNGMTTGQLAQRFGISATHARHIVRGVKWAHLPTTLTQRPQQGQGE